MLKHLYEILFLRHYSEWLFINQVEYPTIEITRIKDLINSGLLYVVDPQNEDASVLSPQVKSKIVNIKVLLKKNKYYNFPEFEKTYVVDILSKGTRKRNADVYIKKAQILDPLRELPITIAYLSPLSIIQAGKEWGLVDLSTYGEVISPAKVQENGVNSSMVLFVFQPYLKDVNEKKYGIRITSHNPITIKTKEIRSINLK